MLAVTDVSAGYDAVDVLHQVSITARPAELTVILGANGSGKTTLFRTISGLLRARSGTITYGDRQLQRLGANRIVRAGVAQCPEGRHLFNEMSVEKNLHLGTYPHRNRALAAETLARVYELFPVLKEKSSALAGSLSGGQQQMVAIGRALMSNPTLLILDEPSMGLAPIVVDQVLEAIVEINAQGTGVLLSEQNARAALAIAHYGFVLSEGRVVVEGSGEELLDDPQVRAAYLGM